MLFNLLPPLADEFIFFNLFRYLTFRSGAAVVTALVISFLVGPFVIRWLKRKQGEGQPIRSRRTAHPSAAQARHADHGRHADPAGADFGDPVVGRSVQRLSSG